MSEWQCQASSTNGSGCESPNGPMAVTHLVSLLPVSTSYPPGPLSSGGSECKGCAAIPLYSLIQSSEIKTRIPNHHCHHCSNTESQGAELGANWNEDSLARRVLVNSNCQIPHICSAWPPCTQLYGLTESNYLLNKTKCVSPLSLSPSARSPVGALVKLSGDTGLHQEPLSTDWCRGLGQCHTHGHPWTT